MSKLFAKLIEPPRDHIPKERQLFSNADLKSLIIPLIFEQILVMLVGMADTMMVSHAGEAAISGVSLVDMINGVFLYVFNALATGGTIVVSQYMGHKDLESGKKSASQLVMISVVLSFLFLGLMTIGNRALLGLLFGSIEADVMDAALTYLIITAFSYPFMAAYSAFAALFRAMGNSKITMKVSLGMNVINVIGTAIG
ncbi:MAG: MATE family efflux transporter, partial [Lachnospiraceae bacterium]|nr:MATE family efflux transporter [Lachnospiraceae bacterium]